MTRICFAEVPALLNKVILKKKQKVMAIMGAELQINYRTLN